MQLIRSFVVLLICCLGISGVAQPLQTSPAHRMLLDREGKPFFWMGDTSWELFHRLDREEAARYFVKRKSQGFNVIQAVVLHELQAFEVPNAYGDFPLVEKDINQLAQTPGTDPTDANAYDYWDHVRYLVALAVEQDLIVAVLPCWGEYVTPRKRNRVISTPEEGYQYGHYIGEWLADYNDHIVWMLGGDRLPDEQPQGVEIWRSMAEGITDAINGQSKQDGKADFDQTSMTYHCFASSANWFAEDDWIDFHTWGSYHEKRNNDRAYLAAWAEWQKTHETPFLNSEPLYENLPINYDWAKVSNGRFDAFDARQAAYWSVFGGAAGHTYGAHEVWMMHKAVNKNPPLSLNLEIEWEDALDLPGGHQMQHLRDLMESVDGPSRKPDLMIVAENPHDPMGKMIACRGDGYHLVYAPTGKIIRLHAEAIQFPSFQANWLNPRTGKELLAKGEESALFWTFDPPGEPERGNDWVLVLRQE
ncbi:MAG: glycoside hydrolase family 140 protein [Bacteroidota bacterium]